ncbi:MAG: inositol monophosphatase [Deltaproteobacteria bacterium]|nr:inositol monophosphatase [Deltaproteobacteria bacterium]MBW2067929.1 inositol monophosphatase [Deltaproteobacteria bacterium]
MTRDQARLFLDAMIGAAREAGEIIRKVFSETEGGVANFEQKSAFDYVTETDKLCEKTIMEALKICDSSVPVVGEESFSGKELPSSCWIVDPLDGTTNFIHRFPVVSVSIARLENGKIIAGCVYDPLRDEIFTAIRGEGAYLNGRKMECSTNQEPAVSLIATGFPFRRKDITDAYFCTFREVFLKVSDIRRAGSAALDLAYVACGRLDGFWEVGLKPWDVAAGILFIEEAGGIVTDFWKRKQALYNGNIIAASNRALYDILTNAVTRHLLGLLNDA